MPKLKFKLPEIETQNLSLICGPVNSNIEQIENSLAIKIKSRGNSFSISGEKNNVVKARMILEDLASLAETSDSVSPDEVHFSICRALNGTASDSNGTIFELETEKDFTIQTPKLYVTPRNKAQEKFVQSILDHDIAFGVGPAGTGKTYIAVAAAVNMFVEEKVNKIILTRPAVEAGEHLGFLPGDLSQKVDPYLRPLYDALFDMMGPEKVGRLIENGKLTKVIKNPNYRGVSTPFWNSLKGVGDDSTFGIYGTPNCGKGEPNQVIRVGHASPVCLFDKVQVFGGV